MYEGLWERDKPHGTGTCMFSSGEVYEGGWREGLMHGHGSMRRPDTVEVYEGKWDHGGRQGVGKQASPTKGSIPFKPRR